ncbi:DUF1097 domain-containing protein [Jiella sp. M17.18]|uniref:DUF1097 domain-containing protein n=1 Tax=Jiella sp. M17.18 TaxID=3234247 RepID=UPI0034DF921B
MPLLTALAISIGVLGGLATWAFVGPAAGVGLQIWAAFVAWAAFYHSGGKTAALRSNVPAHILGAVIGWLALVGTTSLAGRLGVPAAAGICVAIGAAAMVFAANLPMFASIPSSVYGFACVAAYALLANKLGTLYAGNIVDNPLINIVASMVIGSVLGYLSEAIGVALSRPTPTPKAPARA